MPKPGSRETKALYYYYYYCCYCYYKYNSTIITTATNTTPALNLPDGHLTTWLFQDFGLRFGV